MTTARLLAFAELGRSVEGMRRSTPFEFAEMMAIGDPEILQELQDTLEEEIGRIDRLFDVTLNPETDTFTGRAEQRLNLAKSQFYQFTAGPNDWNYKLIPARTVNPSFSEFDPESDADWQGAIEFAAKKVASASPKSQKKLNCKPGNVQCGGKCQRGDMNCRHNPKPDQQQAVQAIATKAKAKKTKTKAAPATDSGAIAPTAVKPKVAKTPATTGDAAPATDASTPAKASKQATPVDTPPADAATSKGATDGGDRTAKPSLQPKSFNPDAIPDLSVEDFVGYRRDKKFLDSAGDPNEPHNQTLDQFGGSKANYKLAVLNSLTTGFAPSDEVLSSAAIKLNKKQQQLRAQNQQEIADKEKSIARIEKAFSHPLVEPEVAAKHKANMSQSEADAYTAGSVLGGLNFYHGNRMDVTDSIANDGAKPELNYRGIYGQGTYFAASKKVAEDYAAMAGDGKGDVGLLTSQVRSRNPYVATSEQLFSIAQNFSGDQSNGTDSVALTQFLRARGHDSIYLKDFGYAVAFDGKQVVTTGNEKILESSDRRKQMLDSIETTNEQLKVTTANSDTAKAANALKPTEDKIYDLINTED